MEEKRRHDGRGNACAKDKASGRQQSRRQRAGVMKTKGIRTEKVGARAVTKGENFQAQDYIPCDFALVSGGGLRIVESPHG
jgi:hypothetical protein